MSTQDIKIPTAVDHALSLRHHRKVVLVVDLVESVSLMRADELGIIQLWQTFLGQVTKVVLPTYKGRLVKSLGDALMLEFDLASQGLGAAFALHAWMETQPSGVHLRAGLHAAYVYGDDLDIYGNGVNLASRIATVARPGETVVSETIHEESPDGIDAEFDDMGECYLKHWPEPVQLWRAEMARPLSNTARTSSSPGYSDAFTPVIAVLPFASRSNDPADTALGDLIADGLIDRISRTPELRVISRLSTSRFRHAGGATETLHTHLSADYVISGSYAPHASKLLVMVELADCKTHAVIWTQRRDIERLDIFQTDSELCNEFAHGCHRALLDSNASAASIKPLPTLKSYSLLLGGIGLMHRSGKADFLKTREVFETLIDRHSRAASPRVWLAKWHVLSLTRGLVANQPSQGAEALDLTKRALDAEPASSIAMAMQGFVYCHLLKDMDHALISCNQALDQNTNESLAWLFKAMLHAFDGNGAEAWPAGERAMMLSPVDPLRYYYDSLMASVAISAGRYREAVVFAERSLRANSIHPSTYRALLLAQSLAGDAADSARTLQVVMKRDPNFSIDRFARNYPARERVPDYLNLLCEAFRTAGVPER